MLNTDLIIAMVAGFEPIMPLKPISTTFYTRKVKFPVDLFIYRFSSKSTWAKVARINRILSPLPRATVIDLSDRSKILSKPCARDGVIVMSRRARSSKVVRGPQ